MTLEELCALAPKFHLDAKCEPISWGLNRDVLSVIAQRVSSGDSTLETGSGMSTVAFALNGCRHTAISPAERELQKIREFCGEHKIPLDDVQMIPQRSEVALPALAMTSLDLVLIDGRHAFPTPFIDWFYTAENLKIGGLMVIDDTQLETGRFLASFMEVDPHWRQVEQVANTTFFEKVRSGVHDGGWTDQPYIANLAQ